MKYDSNPVTLNYDQQRMAKRRKTGSARWSGFIYILLFLFIWGGLVYGGFYFTKQYLDQAINNIQQTNAMNIQELKERMESLTNEMIALKGELSNTDQT